MTLLPILMLAAGLNTAIASPAPVSHAQRAEATLNRAVAVAAPELRQRALERAFAENRHDLDRSLARKTATPQTVHPAIQSTTRTRRARATLNRLVNAAQARLAARAVNDALAENLQATNRTMAREIAISATAHEIARRIEKLAANVAFTSPK